MTNPDPSAWLPDQQPTTDRHPARWLAICIWFLGIFSLVAERATGAVQWYCLALAMYAVLVPLGIFLSTWLRTHQRDLDRLWAERVRDLAVRDELTGLFNRRHFNAELERLVSECLGSNSPLSVAFVDLNDFKTINDTHGHHAGDAALRSVAHCLLELVGDRGIVARTGGDEFGIVLSGMSEAGAQALFGPACRTLPIPVPGCETLTIGGTVGIASLDGTADVGQLLRRADDRLYEKKRARHPERRVA